MGRLCSLVGQFNRLHKSHSNLFASARDSHSIFLHVAGPLLDEFKASLDDVDVPEDVAMLPSNE